MKRALAGSLFLAYDADDEPCVWIATRHPEFPSPVIRRCDLNADGRDQLWQVIEASLPMLTAEVSA